MRIAIASAKLDPQHGGAESWSIGLARWLNGRGHDVHLVGFKAARNLSIDPSNIHLIKPTRGRMQNAELISNWLRGHPFDIIHDMGLGYHFDVFQPHFGSFVAMERGKQKSLTLGQRITKRLVKPFAIRRRTVEGLASLQFNQPNATYIAVSGMVGNDLNRLETIPKDRIQIVPNGVDTERFDPKHCEANREQARKQLSIKDDALVVSVIAHNHQLKGVQQAIEAVRNAHDFPVKIHLLVVGGHGQRLRQLDFGYHRVTYLGNVVDTMDIFPATDVYLHPTFYDACCLSFLEAMACGITSITTPVNGAFERIVHGQSGLILDDPKDIRQIIHLLRSVVDPAKRTQIGMAARDAALSWTIEDNYMAIELLYQKRFAQNCIEQPSPAKPSLRIAA
ncbi:MAG: glycosyltransferase family 4 protein [Pirellulaceae bacterium]|nr:glycosyltransferase family 4 protein [Pirellulaceae bacterium]